MGASKFTRNKDYSDDANNNAGGRDTIDPAGLDGEMDEIKTVTDDHADRLDNVQRDDGYIADDFLQGHEFSPACLTILAGLIGTNSALVWRSDWATTTEYAVGNLVASSGVIYICLVAHTSGSGAFSVGTEWEEFINPASVSIPSQAGNADKSLITNGTTYAWAFVAAANAPTLAPKASPTFTGTVTIPYMALTGPINASIETVAQVAGGNTFDFDTEFFKTVDVTADYTGPCSASNITLGDMMEVHFSNGTGADKVLDFDTNWTWMGYEPDSLEAGKKGVLTLRAIYAATAAGIVATWAVEP